jgi:large subunit ribosomal protein L10
VNRDEKIKFVETMKQELASANSLIIVHYQGLTVSDISKLRAKVHAAGITFQVVKNKLMKIAVEGTDFGSISAELTGPVGIAISSDPIAAAKTMVSFANDNEKLKIIAGVVDKKMVNQVQIKSLATLPSLDELRAKLIGLISAPATKIATVLSEPASQIARVLNANSSKK